MLMMGSYDSKIAFWEPMIPYSFVNGTASWVTILCSQHSASILPFITFEVCICCCDCSPVYLLFYIMYHFKRNSYEESVTYFQQTISLPGKYSVSYDAASAVTTLTIKGRAVACFN
jgi:hypothetical protein